MNKILRRVCDVVTAVLLAVCIGCAAAFSTIGNPSFYKGYYSREEVTQQLEEKISDSNEQVAIEIGVDFGALDYALREKIDLDRIKLDIPSSIFNGINTDYSQSENIDDAYRDGISEYYSSKGLQCDPAVIENAVTLACDNFNKTMGASNMNELSNCSLFVSKYAKAVCVVTLVLIIILVSRTYALNHGRTKTFAHIGSSLISSGCCFITAFIMNCLIDFPERLQITSNEIIMGAISYGVDKYFKVLVVLGVILIVCGFIAFRFVYHYYVNKHASQLQEEMINEKLRDDILEVSNSIENTENGDFENGNE